ncbi:MAG: hypothetical protein LIO68_02245 [Rikenellaceae bacterium]|nr:hypothetical protein [Rikenellaceae bacterium]
MPRSGDGKLSPWRDFTVTNGPWQGPVTGNNPLTGRHFAGVALGHIVWQPASGIRHYIGGVLIDCGTGSGDWTTALSESNAAYFYITYGGVHPYVWNARAHCLPVRCVRE